MKPLLSIVGVGWLALGVVGCKPAKTEAPKATPAVHVSKTTAEADLATVTLTAQAEQRLGIVTVAATRQKVGRTRTYGGDLLLPLGRAQTAADGGAAQDRSVYSLLPATTPAELIRAAELQVDADGQIMAAQVQLDAAQVAAKRAEDLVASKAGVGRTVDEARTQVLLAAAALKTAQAKRALLGTPVFDAVKQSVLWVRVPVYVGDLPQINGEAPARLGGLGGRTNDAHRMARPVSVPFSTTATPGTSDLFYEVANEDGSLRPGQKVVLSLPLRGEEESLVVPAAAILYDIHGGIWVYENTAPHTFIRRRVELRHIAGAGAVLARGPQPGAKIVTDGAAELFGTEFGAGK